MERILEAIAAGLRDLVAFCHELPWAVLDRVLVDSGNQPRRNGRHAR